MLLAGRLRRSEPKIVKTSAVHRGEAHSSFSFSSSLFCWSRYCLEAWWRDQQRRRGDEYAFPGCLLFRSSNVVNDNENPVIAATGTSIRQSGPIGIVQRPTEAPRLVSPVRLDRPTLSGGLEVIDLRFFFRFRFRFEFEFLTMDLTNLSSV